jgi:predicted histone-like DNA-binding protein
MPQLLKRIKNTNTKSPSYGKYYVAPVYPEKFIGTKELADFIQSQATVKRSDCIAVLDELGSALHHFLNLGQKVKLENIGIFKVGVSSAPSNTAALCTAANVKTKRVNFQPEVTSTLKQVKVSAKTGRQYQVFTREATMLEGITFEIAPDAGEQPVEPEP